MDEEEKEKKMPSFDELFKELKTTYPSKVSNGVGGFRRLYGDNKRCEKLYREQITAFDIVSIEQHQLILTCLKLQIKELKRGRSGLQFMQNLGTWLYQRTWENYEEDAKKVIKDGGFKDKSNIFVEEQKGHQDDI